MRQLLPTDVHAPALSNTPPESQQPVNAVQTTRPLPLPARIALVHAILVFAIWLLLFVAKWFPYGPLAEVRDWLYRFF